MLLKRLTEASGVSGNEKEVRDIIIEEIKDHVDNYEIDKIGNVIVYKKGNVKGPRLLIAAHMDEVGLMVSDIDDSGLIKFIPVGGIDKRILVSKRVKVGNKKIDGVIGAKPIHLQKAKERKNALDLKQLYVDIGTYSKEETEKLIKIGDYISFDSDFREFGDNLIKAKALDDRIGCALLIELLQTDNEFDIYGAFTVMEEVGLRGAGPAAFKIEPDIAIILEGTTCADLENSDTHLQATRLGEGPAISLMDRTTYFNKELRDLLIKVAHENNIKYQYRKTSVGGNDSGTIHLSKEGVKTATISVPCRNIHTPVSVINKSDYENAYNLLQASIKKILEGGIN
ncbi:M42 family metallopeptidase [Clostridium sp. D2Q-11]|uniref:M42 family metallopeptidase n=1 Tax=Anaeromonas frigoriresistens TaxID=2683708 RepID=A0A942UZL8_9FIRM|nr:M42 family metallopeptidase [Anaeromonas frigoriresistens]MBS4539936.1 M42 family metallopeptidase [Anaeromonas frigoriresistens]